MKQVQTPQPSSGPLASSLLVLVVLSCVAFSETYFGAIDEFSTHDLIQVGVVALVALLGQMLSVLLTRLIFKSPFLETTLLALFGLLNFYCLYLTLSLQFSTQPLWVRLGLLGIGFFIVHTLFKITRDHHHGGHWIALLLLVPLVINVSTYVLGSQGEEPQGQFYNDLADSRTSSPNIKQVEFSRTPNVYMIAFDALIPRPLTQKFLELEGTAFHEVLDAELVRFKNAFTPFMPTKPSLNSLLAMDEEYFMSEALAGRKLGLFQGFTPSPLFEIFSANGYTTNTVFHSRYFGAAKGPFVDKYPVGTNFKVCQFLEEETSWLVLFGVCKLQQSWRWNQYMKTFGIGATGTSDNQAEFLLEQYAKGLESGAPQIFLSYMYSPRHTPRGYRHADETMRRKYVQDYANNSVDTAEIIKKVVDFLRRQDEQAILYIFGDHGTKVSKGVSVSDNPEFVIPDRHGVYAGVYPKDVCREYFAPLHDSEFTTTIRIVRQLITCLADGQDPFINEPNYVLQALPEVTLRYEDFLYE